jgi:hypothetical protein
MEFTISTIKASGAGITKKPRVSRASRAFGLAVTVYDKKRRRKPLDTMAFKKSTVGRQGSDAEPINTTSSAFIE